MGREAKLLELAKSLRQNKDTLTENTKQEKKNKQISMFCKSICTRL